MERGAHASRLPLVLCAWRLPGRGTRALAVSLQAPLIVRGLGRLRDGSDDEPP